MKKQVKDFVYDVKNVLTIRELHEEAVKRYGDRPAFCVSEGNELKEITFNELNASVKAFCSYIRSLVPEGSRVAVTGKNSYNWVLSYLSITCGVGVVVPIDKDLRADEIETLVDDSKTELIIYSPEQEEKVAALKDKIICLNMADMDEYIEKGNELRANGDNPYENHKINPLEMGILLYTSGTTGVAKGVMLSQYNVCFDALAALRRVKIFSTDRIFSIAPLHHTYECTVGFLLVHYCGACIFHNTSLRRIQSELKLFKPTVMAAVPLVLETFRNAIVKKYSQMKGGKFILSLQKIASDFTSNKGGKKIFSVINETFGGQLRLIVCGAALLSPDVYRDYQRFGIKILIGYGLTETAPICIMHNDSYSSPDDIGYPMSGVEVKLEDVNDEGVGELCVRGPNVMLGYYNNPEETAKVIDEDGFFHTGDLARITPNGSYQIAGRAKSMIVSPGGKKIFPEELELFIEKSEYVKESMVYETTVDGVRKIAVAVVTDGDFVKARLIKDGVDINNEEEYAEKEKALIGKVISEVNSKFPTYKHINKVYIRKTDFEKTTTKKIKRNSQENTNNED